MELFLDSANLADIQACTDSGIISGITVNQSLLAKEPKRPYIEHIQAIIEIIGKKKLHLTAPVPTCAPEAMIDFGKAVGSDIHYANFSLKIPVSIETLPVIRGLSEGGHGFSITSSTVNATCVFNAQQAMMAASAGAQVVSVFVGRINDIGTDGRGYDVIREIVAMKLGVKIIAGSIRNSEMVLRAAMAGADIVTTSRTVLESLADEEHSKASADKFNADWIAWNR